MGPPIDSTVWSVHTAMIMMIMRNAIIFRNGSCARPGLIMVFAVVP